MNARFLPPFFGQDLDRGALWNAFVAIRTLEVALTETSSVRFDLADAPPPDAWCLLVEVAGRPSPLVATFRAFPFKDLFGVELDTADLAGLPQGVREALQDGLRAVTLAMLPETLAGRMRVAAAGPALSVAPAGDDIQWLAVRLAQPNGLYAEVLIGWPRALIVAEVGRTLLCGVEAGAPLAAHLAVPVDTTLGGITLPVGDLGALAPGAVVVLPAGAGGSVMMRAGELLYTFTDTGQGWRSSGPEALGRHRPRAARHATGQATMDEETPDSEPTLSIGDLTLAVDFDLGRLTLPLATVAAWQPGTVVDVAPPSLDNGVEVTIRANGDVVGHGDLVRIDDRIGVRITRMLLRS